MRSFMYVYLANREVWTHDSFDFSGQNFTLFHLRGTLKNLLIPFKRLTIRHPHGAPVIPAHQVGLDGNELPSIMFSYSRS